MSKQWSANLAGMRHVFPLLCLAGFLSPFLLDSFNLDVRPIPSKGNQSGPDWKRRKAPGLEIGASLITLYTVYLSFPYIAMLLESRGETPSGDIRLPGTPSGTARVGFTARWKLVVILISFALKALLLGWSFTPSQLICFNSWDPRLRCPELGSSGQGNRHKTDSLYPYARHLGITPRTDDWIPVAGSCFPGFLVCWGETLSRLQVIDSMAYKL